MPETIGDYQYSKRDLIGHGAFAIVFLGHSRSVCLIERRRKYVFFLVCLFFEESRTTSRD